MPETRVTEGNFHIAETALAVPKGHPEVLRLASELIRKMKAEGTVMASFHRHNMPDAVVPA
jgi:polar amino acid transport system substrate-binding protein